LETTLYSNRNEGGKTTVTLEILADGSLQLFFYDIGEDSLRVWGDSDYENWITVAPAEIPRLAFALLAEKYGGRSDSVRDLEAFCRANAIACEQRLWT
jgi:hypothetical protein